MIVTLGNRAVHHHRPIPECDSTVAVKELFHVCYWLASENLLFTGDCLVNTEGLSGSRPQYTYNAEQAIATVKKLAQPLVPLGFGRLGTAFGMFFQRVDRCEERVPPAVGRGL